MGVYTHGDALTSEFYFGIVKIFGVLVKQSLSLLKMILRPIFKAGSIC